LASEGGETHAISDSADEQQVDPALSKLFQPEIAHVTTITLTFGLS